MRKGIRVRLGPLGIPIMIACSGCVMYVPDRYSAYDPPTKPLAWTQPYAPPQVQDVDRMPPPPMDAADPVDPDVLSRCQRHEAPQDVEACIMLNREMQRQGTGWPRGRIEEVPQVEAEELPPSPSGQP